MVRKIVVELDPRPARNTGLVDANNRPLKGIPVEFGMEIIDAPGTFDMKDEILVVENGTWGLLGQTSLERIGANLQNFPDAREGRRFALYPRPTP
jgi:hypothetical protein